MPQFVPILRFCRLGLHAVAVVLALAALVVFIVSTARGIHPPAIGAGYIASLFCLVVNCYVLAAWWNVKQQKSNAGRWSTLGPVFWSLLHLFTAILTIGLALAISFSYPCNEDNFDDEEDDEDWDEDECQYRSTIFFAGGGILVALFVFHLIFLLGTFVSMWMKRRSKRTKSDPEKNENQGHHDPTVLAGGYTQPGSHSHPQSDGPSEIAQSIPAVQPSYGIPQRKSVPHPHQHDQEPGVSRDAQSVSPSSVGVSSLNTSQQESSPHTVSRQGSPQVPHTMAAVASDPNASTRGAAYGVGHGGHGGPTHGAGAYNIGAHGIGAHNVGGHDTGAHGFASHNVSELTESEAYTELPAQTPVEPPTNGRAELG